MARHATRKTAKKTTSKKAAKRTVAKPTRRATKSAAKRMARSAAKRTSVHAARRKQQTPRELSDLFLETLKDIYTAEKQILRALPKMAKAVQSDELRSAFEKHRQETEGQVGRLDRVFAIIGQRPGGKKCPAIEGLVEEGKEVMQQFQGSNALDAGLLAGAQAVEHYEISRYGTLKAWASQLGMNEALQLLEETLNEEKRTDKLLTQIAEGAINPQAEAA